MNVGDNITKCLAAMDTGVPISRDIIPVEKEYAIAYINEQIAESVERIRAAHNE